MKFGVQLWFVQDEIRRYGMNDVLKRIARAGYDCVEFTGFYGLGAKNLKRMLDRHGLQAVSAHIGFNGLEESLAHGTVEQSLPYIVELGLENVYLPWIESENLQGENFERTVELLEEQIAFLSPYGVRYGYHNHDHEYANGADNVAKLLARVPKLCLQYDVFWGMSMGIDPVGALEKYKDKLCAVHYKEMDLLTKENVKEYPTPIVGEGKCRAEQVVKKAKQLGAKHLIVEVEKFPCGIDEYYQKSLRALQSFL